MFYRQKSLYETEVISKTKNDKIIGKSNNNIGFAVFELNIMRYNLSGMTASNGLKNDICATPVSIIA